jgi:hypothetical protein
VRCWSYTVSTPSHQTQFNDEQQIVADQVLDHAPTNDDVRKLRDVTGANIKDR